MTDFNIESLLQFHPAEFICPKCFALLRFSQIEEIYKKKKKELCPTCGVHYLPSDEHCNIRNFVKDLSFYKIENKDLLQHSAELAGAAQSFKSGLVLPVRTFFRILSIAKEFVHFTTYGISDQFIGALKLAAHRINIRGIVSNVEARQTKELEGYKKETLHFSVKTYGTRTNWANMSHQKILIVDGLLAFKGSANLTLNGWRKVANNRDVLEVVTNVDEVIKLNNRFFSPVWAELSGIEDVFRLDLSDIPLEAFPF